MDKPEEFKKLWRDIDAISAMEKSIFPEQERLMRALEEMEEAAQEIRGKLEDLKVPSMAERKLKAMNRLRELCGAPSLDWFSVRHFPKEGTVYVAKPGYDVKRYREGDMGRSCPDGGVTRNVYLDHALYAVEPASNGEI